MKLERRELIFHGARGGVLVGLIGLCAVLATREEKFECTSQCGRCPKLMDGRCTLNDPPS